MTEDLRSRTVEKRPERVTLAGRVLLLLDDVRLLEEQLYQGRDLDLTDELRGRLRDQISTDEITPAYICYFYDETLGEFPYLGLRAKDRESGEDRFPVRRGAVKAGGFVCSVAGKRRGKGSSREQSPYAELMAGIQLVVAESIERIYNENCQNLGILTSTDFSLLERVRAGEEIPLAEFTRGADPVTRQIIEYGGLFEFNVARLQGRALVPLPECLGGPSTEGAPAGPDNGAAGRDAQDLQRLRGSGEPDVSDATPGEYAAPQIAATSAPSNRPRPSIPRANGGVAGGDAERGLAQRGGAHEEGAQGGEAQADRPPAGEGPVAEDTAAGPVQRPRARRPMTLAEKIFAAHWVVDAARDHVGVPWVRPGEAGFFRTDLRFSHEYVTPMSAIFFEQKVGQDGRVEDPGSILFFRDHLTFLHKAMTQERIEEGLLEVANQLEVKQREFAERQGIRLYGEQKGHVIGSEAICHSKVLETYAEPGMLIIGSDSHTPHAGAIGCVAFGVGTTAVFNAWITRDVRAQVPASFKVVVSGTPAPNVCAKDYMLEILRHPYVRDGQAIGQIVEYAGPAVESLSVDERATMTNMAAEVGAFAGIVAPDARAVDYLVAERGLDRALAERMTLGMRSDPDAEYVTVIEVDASQLRPMAALPSDPGNGVYLDELEAKRIRIDIAYAGSCTAGKKEDMDMYARGFGEAWERWGVGVHPDVRCYVQCGSVEVREYCRQRGYLDLFERVGATFIEPGCGACINAGPGATYSSSEVSVSSQNRNFPGRSGPGQLYLVSPFSVAASAVAGYVTGWRPGERPAPAKPVAPPREPVAV